MRSILAGMFVLVGIGSALASNYEPTSASLDIPTIQVGDSGAYSAATFYRDGTPAGERAGHWTELRFLWHAPQILADDVGRPHATTIVETYVAATPGGDWTSSWAEWALDIDNTTLRHDVKWTSTSDESSPGQWVTAGNQTHYRGGSPLCGLRNSLQGTTGSAPKSMVAYGSCSHEAGLSASKGIEFQLQGIDVLDHVRTVQYVAKHGLTKLWFVPGVSAPFQVEQPAIVDGQILDTVVRLRLQGWQPGHGPETMPPMPSEARVALPLHYELGDRLTGPIMGGLDHPFSHHDAWWAAMQDSRSGLANFFASRPTAYLLQAYSYGLGNGVQESFTWRFTVTDGLAAHGAFVTQSTIAPLEGLPLDTRTRVNIGTFTVNASPAWLPDPEQLPDPNFPTVASLLDRWSFLRDRDQPTQAAYGFGYTCPQSGCAQTSLWMFAGESESRSALEEVVDIWDVLRIDQTDQLTLVREDRQEITQVGFGNVRPLPPMAEPRSVARPPVAPLDVAAAWAVTPSAAGTLTLAFLVALAAYFWPGLKTGFLSLFSRLAPEDLAGHPTRQAILGAIEHEPGIHFQAICRAVGRGRGVVGHHLAKLVDGGHVEAHRQGGFTCYIPTGGQVASLKSAAALKAKGARTLLAAICSQPGRSGIELAQQTGLSPSTIHYHARSLVEAGLIEIKDLGRSRLMHPTTQGRGLA